mgnify:CR=1 FL=1
MRSREHQLSSSRRTNTCSSSKAYLFLLLTAATWYQTTAGRTADLPNPDTTTTSTRTTTTSTTSTPSSSSTLHSKRFESPILHGERYANVTRNAQLSSWEAAVADLPDCKRGSWQEMATGSWYMDAAGEVSASLSLILIATRALWGRGGGGGMFPPAGHTHSNQVHTTAGGQGQSLTSDIHLPPREGAMCRGGKNSREPRWFSCCSHAHDVSESQRLA